jgi:hypothetical protein
MRCLRVYNFVVVGSVDSRLLDRVEFLVDLFMS